MKRGLSVVTITRNAARILDLSLCSARNIANEIIIVDNNSTDETLSIAKKYEARIYPLSTNNLGQQKEYGVKQAKYEWVLILDSDEVILPKLQQEIKKAISKPTKYYGFEIPYQNHLFGKPLYYGGENYHKMVLFKKKYASIRHLLVHEHFRVKNLNHGRLKNKMQHFSYLNLLQMYAKFTDYAIRDARQKKLDFEKSSLAKIFKYPAHMFWARYIKDKGYKDYWPRIFLDLGFAYMEFLTYSYLALLNLKQ